VTVFLESNVVVYFVEKPPVWGQKAMIRIAASHSSGDRLAISDLVRMECLVSPLRSADTARISDFTAFFTAPDVDVLGITPALCDRAAAIRATHGFRPLDSLHLAAAVEHGCGWFLTNDAQLRRFPEITVEVLT
jgi:uncharacterized protein